MGNIDEKLLAQLRHFSNWQNGFPMCFIQNLGESKIYGAETTDHAFNSYESREPLQA
jgi:hypothetical protein